MVGGLIPDIDVMVFIHGTDEATGGHLYFNSKRFLSAHIGRKSWLTSYRPPIRNDKLLSCPDILDGEDLYLKGFTLWQDQ